MPNLIPNQWRQAKRIVQTQIIVQKNAFKWLLGKKPLAPVQLKEIFEELGTTYIKLGQLVASMPSVFPEEYVSAFQSCLDQTNPLPYSTIEKILQTELGDSKQFFSWIDPQPIASASIAQVHAATLLSGEDVVIKVQRPDALNTLQTDLSMLHILSKTMEFIAPKFKHMSLADMVSEIKLGMIEECDFIKEATNIEEYQKFLTDLGTDKVRVPKVYNHASTSKILTMERFYGVPLTDLEAIKNHNDSPETSLIDALNVWFASVSQCRIYHADLHSGNIMLLNNGQIGFIDFGIVGSISDEIWQALLTLSTAIPAGDFNRSAMALLKLGATKEAIDTDALANDLEKLYNDTIDIDSTQMDSVDSYLDSTLLKLNTIAKSYGLRFPRAFTLLIKQFLYFDKYIQVLAPELNIFQDERILIH